MVLWLSENFSAIGFSMLYFSILLGLSGGGIISHWVFLNWMQIAR